MSIWVQVIQRLRDVALGLRRPPAVQGPDDRTEASPPTGAEVVRGCGWFDSSLDLRQGLAVIEHRSIDLAVALELMLTSDHAPQP